MRLQIYVPVRYGQHWSPEAEFVGWERFLRELTKVGGAVAVTNTSVRYFGRDTYGAQPAYLVEAFPSNGDAPATYEWMRAYARQLLGCGEEAIVLVHGHDAEVLRA